MENSGDLKSKQEPLIRTSGGRSTINKMKSTLLNSRRSTTTNRIINARIWSTNAGAIWAIFSLLMQNMPEIYTVYIISNYGSPIMVAGAGLGVMFINMLVYGIFEGMNGAIDTLVSQYFGNGDLKECSYVYNRACVINSIVYIPVAILLYFSNHLLDLLNQPQEVSYYARLYLVIQIPGLYCIVQYDTLRRYLQAQGCFDMPTKLLCMTFIFHVCFVTTVTHFVNYNPLVVCSMATNITLFLDMILLSFLSRNFRKDVDNLSFLEGAFSDWRVYFEYALPSAFILCAEWWMYEVLAIFAGMLGVIYLATLIIILNTHNIVYVISYGLSQAVCSQIGRTLAEFGKSAAQMLLKLIAIFQLALCVLITIMYLFFSKQIIYLFSRETEIIDLFVSCKYLIILMFIFDSSQIVIGGVIRGIGEQGDSSIISFISYGLITIPLTLVLSFWYDLQLYGILISYIAGIAFNTIFNAIILSKSKWELAIDSEEVEQIIDFN